MYRLKVACTYGSYTATVFRGSLADCRRELAALLRFDRSNSGKPRRRGALSYVLPYCGQLAMIVK